MKAKLLIERKGETETLPAGSVIDHPDAFQLVQFGVAEPADDECAEKCGMSAEQMEAAQAAATRTRLGIHPEDFDLYEAGLMNGYTDKGEPTLDGVKLKPSAIEKFRQDSLDAEEKAD